MAWHLGWAYIPVGLDLGSASQNLISIKRARAEHLAFLHESTVFIAKSEIMLVF